MLATIRDAAERGEFVTHILKSLHAKLSGGHYKINVYGTPVTVRWKPGDATSSGRSYYAKVEMFSDTAVEAHARYLVARLMHDMKIANPDWFGRDTGVATMVSKPAMAIAHAYGPTLIVPHTEIAAILKDVQQITTDE